MKTYGINLVLRRSVGTTTTTGHIPVAAAPNGAMEALDRETADAAIEHWTSTHPDQEFELVEVRRTLLETYPATEKKENN